jgi:glutamyl-tRNA(Gln) amidotransferase subunit E
LEIALEIALLLDCNIVSELHVSRKQYLDGSIPTGFQRTTIVGVEGTIPVEDRHVRIIQLGLEEDACREVSDIGHERVYRTDRLGIPLVETVTYPDMQTPYEVAVAAQVIRYLTRATGKVRTGIGAARQDVNVSVTGSTRVEIKGVPRIKMIPRLVHNEGLRQRALLDIRQELKRRSITDESFVSTSFDVTEQLKGTSFAPIAQAVNEGGKVFAVVLKGYVGILNHPTQPETVFAKEIIDRVRVIACLDRFPNLIHSDQSGGTLLSGEWSRLRRTTGCGDRDTLVVSWGPAVDVERAAEEIAIRAREATLGIPSETRQALSDGTNGFERILPGPDRMYPDTDLPPLAVSEQMVQAAREQLPEPPWLRQQRYEKNGVPKRMAEQLARSRLGGLFDRLCGEAGISPTDAASFLTGRFQGMTRQNANGRTLEDDEIVDIAREVVRRGVEFSLTGVIIEGILAGRWTNPNDMLKIKDFSPMVEGEAKSQIDQMIAEVDLEKVPGAKQHRYLMGRIMDRLRGRLNARRVSELLMARLTRTAGDTAPRMNQ